MNGNDRGGRGGYGFYGRGRGGYPPPPPPHQHHHQYPQGGYNNNPGFNHQGPSTVYRPVGPRPHRGYHNSYQDQYIPPPQHRFPQGFARQLSAPYPFQAPRPNFNNGAQPHHDMKRGGRGARSRGGHYNRGGHNSARGGRRGLKVQPQGFLVITSKPMTLPMVEEVVDFFEQFAEEPDFSSMVLATEDSKDELNFHGDGSWDNVNLSAAAVQTISEKLFPPKPTVIQEAILKAFMSDCNIISHVPHFSANRRKDICALLALSIVDVNLSHPQLLIMCQNRELAQNLEQVIATAGRRFGLRTCLCIGGTEIDESVAHIKEGPHVLVGTLGRVYGLLENEELAFVARGLKSLIIEDTDNHLQMDMGLLVFKLVDLVLKCNPYAQIILLDGIAASAKVCLEDRFPRDTLYLRLKSVLGDAATPVPADLLVVGNDPHKRYYLDKNLISSCAPKPSKTEIGVMVSQTVSVNLTRAKASNSAMSIDEISAKETTVESVTVTTPTATGPSKRSMKNNQFFEMQGPTMFMEKPQLKFKNPTVNDDSPFIPKISSKPNAMSPLNLDPVEDPQTGKLIYENPYKVEISKWKPPAAHLEMKNFSHEPYLSTLDIDFLYVETEETLQQMMSELATADVIGFDAEHSDRSYFGLTCLLQVSSRDKDYVIDTLALRDSLSCLNEHFTNPAIVKIAHEGRSDVEYLQKDLGVYVVGLWDTRVAESTMPSNTSRTGLMTLLQKYANVDTDKKYQMADWRIRPLPEEMMLYARTDSRYLPEIYDKQRQVLWDHSKQTSKLISQVFESGNGICASRYEKPNSLEWLEKNRGLNNQQMHALTELTKWRTETAKVEDESIFYVCSNKILLKLAQELPQLESDLNDILLNSRCGRITDYMYNDMEKVLKILNEARNVPLVDPKLQEMSRKVIARYNFQTFDVGTNEIYFVSKGLKAANLVYKIIEGQKGQASTKIPIPEFITTIFPSQIGCKCLPSDLLCNIKSLLLPLEGVESASYEILLRDEYDRKDEHEKLIKKLVSVLHPSWVLASPADYCIIAYFSKGFFNLAVLKDCEKYNYFKIDTDTEVH